MKTKIALAISMALLSGTSAVGASDLQLTQELKNYQGRQSSSDATLKFVPEPELGDEVHTYIVGLVDKAVANYSGEVSGYKATAPQLSQAQDEDDSGKLDARSPEVRAYASFLETKQDSFLTRAQASVGSELEVLTSFQYAFNGVALRLTQKQAQKLSTLNEVAFIERERLESLDTDASQALIGSPSVWDGSATGVKAMGEGVIVGIIDSGINTDHASFADVGGDGYDHTNPWGQGVYSGDCKTEFASLCNDKLIGVHSYPDITKIYEDTVVFGPNPPAKNGEDYGGHGSHVASTAAGNILKDVPFLNGEVGKVVGDGIPTGLKFNQISGVAPHANIVAFQICRPGSSADKYNSCPSSAILKALDDAVKTGVDVINYSISGGGQPWRSASERAFLAARNAGIFAATSAGNTRTGISQVPFTSSKHAPWYMSVANSSHDRDIAQVLTIGDKKYDFTPSSGPGFNKPLTAPLSYAGTVNAANLLGCTPFAADAFKDKIALIKRGTCAFTVKLANAVAAGAKGLVVFNSDGNGNARLTMSGFETSPIPAVFIGNDDGLAIVKMLETNPALNVTLDPAPSLKKRPADVLSSSSLLGPNGSIDVMAPSISAPGTNIYAAYADQQYGRDKSVPDPADFTLMSGTSMSSPHVAGAGALLKSLHRKWTPDNIRSALMLTATGAQAMKKADGKTTADPFDVGSGRIRIDLAAKTGLIMDESAINYDLANPDIGGDPTKLNLPSMQNSKCVNSCSWKRKVTATADGSWTAAVETVAGEATYKVEPESFSLKKGESQLISVTADVTKLGDKWGFANLKLTSSAHPLAVMPVVVKASKRNLPSFFAIDASRNADEMNVKDLKAIDLPDVKVSTAGISLSKAVEGKVAQDSTNTLPFDNLNEVAVHKVVVPNGALYLAAATTYSNSPDLDLFVISGDKLIAKSERSGSLESVFITKPAAGEYSVIVQNHEASAVGASDDYRLETTLLENTASENFAVKLKGDNQNFELNMAWDVKSLIGDDGLAAIHLTSSDPLIAPVTVPVFFTRQADDVTHPAPTTLGGVVEPGKAIKVAKTIAANRTQETRKYLLSATILADQEAANISHGGVKTGTSIQWKVDVASGEASKEVSFDLVPRKSGMGKTLVVTNKVDNLTGKTISDTYSYEVREVKPVAKVKAFSEVPEGSTMMLDGSGSTDENGDTLTYEWSQTSGKVANFAKNGAMVEVAVPYTNGSRESMSFKLKVTDTQGNTDTKEVTVSVAPNIPTDGGSVGWLALVLAPLAFLRRKMK